MARHFIYIIFVILLSSCIKDKMDNGQDLTLIPYDPKPYVVDLPDHWPPIESPEDNPLTKDGVKLGQHLFYDPILSADSTMSCSSCHIPEKGFTDGKAVSVGIDGVAGTKSSMSLLNLAYTKAGLFWDGRSPTLEDQAALPVEDPIELHDDWKNVESKLQSHPDYPSMFRKAFGINSSSEITKELATKALAQFQRIIVTPHSKYDSVVMNLAQYNDFELMGASLYFDDDPDLPDAECDHCHGKPIMTSDDFFNNGLQQGDGDLNFPDNARGLVTGSKSDNGKFRAPTLRNITLTAPYMHDGRLATLDEVIQHYNSGGLQSKNKDPLVEKLGLSTLHIRGLKAFLATLTDTTYLQNPDIVSPF